LQFIEKSFKINSSRKLNIVNKELTLINHYSADGAKRLVGMAFMTLLEVKNESIEISI